MKLLEIFTNEKVYGKWYDYFTIHEKMLYTL